VPFRNIVAASASRRGELSISTMPRSGSNVCPGSSTIIAPERPACCCRNSSACGWQIKLPARGDVNRATNASPCAMAGAICARPSADSERSLHPPPLPHRAGPLLRCREQDHPSCPLPDSWHVAQMAPEGRFHPVDDCEGCDGITGSVGEAFRVRPGASIHHESQEIVAGNDIVARCLPPKTDYENVIGRNTCGRAIIDDNYAALLRVDTGPILISRSSGRSPVVIRFRDAA